MKVVGAYRVGWWLLALAVAAALFAGAAQAAGLTAAEAPGGMFTAPVELTGADGSVSRVECSFRLTGADTCEVVGDGLRGGAKAVARDLEGSLSIPATVSGGGAAYRVTAVGQYAFGGAASVACKGLSGISLPDGVTEIGAGAFSYCTALADVGLPASLAVIDQNAFSYCSQLGEVSFPGGLQTLGMKSFYRCEGLSRVSFPASVALVGAYAFSQDSGLRTVAFEGDAPSVGLYAFTGEMQVESVLFCGKGMISTEKRFNSDAVEAPVFYYAITFYPSKDAAQERAGAIDRAFVSSETKYMRVTPALAARDGLYAGAVPAARAGSFGSWEAAGRVPAFPAGANVWRCEFGAPRHKLVAGSQYAYADAAGCLDLGNGGEAGVLEYDYRGEAFPLYFDEPGVIDGEGTELEAGIDYVFEYQRLAGRAPGSTAGEAGRGGVADGEGWEPTSDLASAGTLRVVAKGAGQYSGQALGRVDILFRTGTTFVHPVEQGFGSEGTVNCAFEVTSLKGGAGTLRVAKKPLNKREASRPMISHDIALPVDYSGSAVIPDEVDLFGNTLSVTAVADRAFSFDSPFDYEYYSAIELPSTVRSIGAAAFAKAVMMHTVVFRGDLSTTSIGPNAFLSCKRLSRVVFYGTRPDSSLHDLDELFPGDSGVDYYYTVRFYASAGDARSAAPPLGSITVRDDVPLGLLEPGFGGMPEVYDGAVPAFPGGLVDDAGDPKRAWYAPTWMFPEANADNASALRGGLSDSTYAYAEQAQDAFSMDDAFFAGLAPSYDFTGADVIDLSALRIVGPVGGTLRVGTDCRVALQQWDDWDEAWTAADRPLEPGRYRLVATGLGKYASETRYCAHEFYVIADELPAGTVFTEPVPLVTGQGAAASVACRFIVTEVGDDRAVSVYAGGVGDPAVPAGTAGAVEIPGSVEHLRASYRVTALSAYAFRDCSSLTSVSLPDTLVSLGVQAFYGCRSLADAVVPEGVDVVPESAFSKCEMLGSVELGAGVREIAGGAFGGCARLSTVSFPESLESLGAKAFSGCDLDEFTVYPALASYRNGFSDSGLKRVVFAEGVEEVPQAAFYRVPTLSEVSFPSTLRTIGNNAFAGTGIASLDLPASLDSVRYTAFGDCEQLRTVVFEGDANVFYGGYNAFANTPSLSEVVYRDLPPRQESTYFYWGPQARPVTFYVMGRFYASDEDRVLGSPCGAAAIARGTAVADIANGSAAAAGALFDGGIPALPGGCSHWEFDGAALGGTVDEPFSATARAGDVRDLSYGCVVTSGAYPYTGSTVNPITNGTGYVVRADGVRLQRGRDYTVGFERIDGSGAWAPTTNLASVGRVRAVASAVEGSGYAGRAYGYYLITRSKVGDLITAADENGHEVTFKILGFDAATGLGSVSVGGGGTSSTDCTPAVAEDCAGEVRIPELAYDAEGNAFAPTAVAPYAFYRRMGVTKLVVPSTISSIDSSSFRHEWRSGDTQRSMLSTVVFENDMAATSVGSFPFTGCDAVQTVVYGQKKGALERRFPFTMSVGLPHTRYYTTRFYASAADAVAGAEPVATVQLKEGAYVDSPSRTDYYEGSDPIPEAPAGFMWVYESSALDDEFRVWDSQVAYLVERTDDVLVANVRCVTDFGTSDVPCEFTVIALPDGDAPGAVAVGSLEDGRPAVPRSLSGRVVVPSRIMADGMAYEVTRVGAFAFGSSFEDKACGAVTGVDLPAGIAGIDRGAFMNCSSLAAVGGLADTAVTDLGAAAFSGCTALSAIDLPDAAASVGAQAFAGSGLVRAVLPPGLETLGKRAFSDCASLREVVFSGPLDVSLPALPGMPEAASAVGKGAADAASGMRLRLLDDYVLANCPLLERIVFGAPASGLSVSAQALEGSTGLSALVFAGSKADLSGAVASRGDGAAAVTSYYTAGFYLTEDASGDRGGYVVVAAGSSLADVVAGAFGPYAGAVPELPAHYEWVYGAGAAAGSGEASGDGALQAAPTALDDSLAVGMRKITHAIDLSGIDGSFSVECAVDGGQSGRAGAGDAVSVTVSAGGSPAKVARLTVVEARSGASTPLVRAEGSAVTFTMPDGPVRVVADYAASLSVGVVRASGAVGRPVSLGYDELATIASRAEKRFSAWGEYRSARVLESDLGVGLKDALSAAGARFDEGDSILFSSSGGEMAMFSFEDLYGESRSYYPGIASASGSGACATDPTLCLRSAVAEASASGDAGRAPDMADMFQLAFGQTAKEFAKGRVTASSWLGKVDSIKVIYGPERIADCRVTGVNAVYGYTGKAVVPALCVTDIDGVELRAGVDYVATCANNVDAGTATVSIEGKGVYEGSRKLTFKIRRAQLVAGSSAAAVAANTAMAAWPTGSAGAVIAASSGYQYQVVASALAGSLGYPLLYVGKGAAKLPAATAKALSALKSGKSKFEILVVGGKSLVSAKAFKAARSYVRNANYITRIAGKNAYATSREVLSYGAKRKAWGSQVIIASGVTARRWSSAPAAAYAGWSKSPVLLTAGKKLEAASVKLLKARAFKSALVLGSTTAVKAAVSRKAKSLVKGKSVTRLSGSGCALSKRVVARGLSAGMKVDGACVVGTASAADPPACGAAWARSGSVMLVASSSNTATLSALGNARSQVLCVRFSGGKARVPVKVRTAAMAALGWNGVPVK